MCCFVKACKRSWEPCALFLALFVLLTGCRTASGPPLGGRAAFEAMRYRPATPQPAPDTSTWQKAAQGSSTASGGASPRALVARAALSGLQRLDTFEEVLVLAGIDNAGELPPHEAPLSPEEAAALYDVLLDKPVTLASFGPRLVASFLLREAMEEEQELPRPLLLQRVERFKSIAVLRPDGYLAWALTGRTQQRVAPVEWKDGAFRARGFELGRLYSGRNGMAFFPVDSQLRELLTQGPLAEVYDDADVISRVLDGAEESLVELGLALGHLVVHPLDSAEQLRQLPQNLATLLANSPEYLERFRWMTRGEQIEALSKLTTTLYSMHGAAAGTTRMVSGAGRGLEALSMPILSLTVDGALVMERAAVPVGRAVAAMSGGPGATVVLHRANTAARGGQPSPAQGPGQWGPAHEAMSKRAARYQEQISGKPASEAYWVGGVGRKSGGLKFDGFENGALLEAKGPGYANKFDDELVPKKWFAHSGAYQLVEQAKRQRNAARGVPIRWHVAEKKAADAIRKLLKEGEVLEIEVVHTPALQ
jgi:hypothetical protein